MNAKSSDITTSVPDRLPQGDEKHMKKTIVVIWLLALAGCSGTSITRVNYNDDDPCAQSEVSFACQNQRYSTAP